MCVLGEGEQFIPKRGTLCHRIDFGRGAFSQIVVAEHLVWQVSLKAHIRITVLEASDSQHVWNSSLLLID